MILRLLLIVFLCFGPAAATAADVMFEGYYRVDIESKPVGYIILRYAFDPAKKNFEAVSFQRIKFGDKVVQESLKATADDKFHPIAYQYTSQVGDAVKMIDATFKGDIMTLKINDGKKIRTETYKNRKGTFLSSFLPYMMLQQPLEINQAFSYNGIAEEDGGSYSGKAWLQSKEGKSSYDLYTVVNKYHGEEFLSKMAVVKNPKDPKKNIKGEVFGTSSPAKNISTTLMASASTATEGQLVPNKTLITLFGAVPTGKVNMVSSAPQVADSSSTPKSQRDPAQGP
jgi:hypothetical protein